MEESDIIEKFNSGDQHAFKLIFDKYFRLLCYTADKIIHNSAEAEDIASVALLKLSQKRGDFDSFKAMYAFLLKVVEHTCYNYQRRQGRQLKMMQELEYLTPDHESDGERIEAELIQLLYVRMEQLPPQQATVMSMHIDKVDYPEIAKHMKISEQTARNHKTIALNALKKFFGLDWLKS
jgi:RNA polymerase sigma factor (sigma-70 family)